MKQLDAIEKELEQLEIRKQSLLDRKLVLSVEASILKGIQDEIEKALGPIQEKVGKKVFFYHTSSGNSYQDALTVNFNIIIENENGSIGSPSVMISGEVSQSKLAKEGVVRVLLWTKICELDDEFEFNAGTGKSLFGDEYIHTCDVVVKIDCIEKQLSKMVIETISRTKDKLDEYFNQLCDLGHQLGALSSASSEILDIVKEK